MSFKNLTDQTVEFVYL